MSLTFRSLTGAQIAPVLDDVARLRIAVFRDWPYLYDGDLDYERGYLGQLAGSPDAIVVTAEADGRIVGAATGAPMEGHAADFGQAVAAQGMDLRDVFYCAESVLLPEYRGQGAGHAFFDAREAQARALGRRHCLFCAVVRPDDHPARDPAYRPLDAFWKARGYRKIEGMVATFAWRDIGASSETMKPLQFWGKAL